MGILQTLETDAAAILAKTNAAFLSFLGKVKTGEQIIIADVDAAVHAIATHISAIDTIVKQAESWVAEYLPLAQAAGLPANDAAIVNQLVTDTNVLLEGAKAVASTVNSGGSDVNAVVNGIKAAASASKSTSSIVQVLAQLPVPSATQVVSPPSPPVD